MPRFIADLHCDLLCYLQGDSSRTPYNEEVRCSIPQLRSGRVRLQTMAIFTMTERGSSLKGMEQAEVFKLLPGLYDQEFQAIQSPAHLAHLVHSDRIGIVAAIENASGFCEEEGPLEEGLEHLRLIFGKVGRPLYIGFTWNTENRFGGGAETDIGLKEDGRHLLDFLHGKQIAVDFSHTSDALAFDILNYIDAKRLHIPVLASHSNVRSVANMRRNLPDELVKEIIRRGGIIGFNFVKPFVGTEAQEGFTKQLEAFLKLGAEDHLCLGADYFCDDDVPTRPTSFQLDGWFFDEFADSSCYGKVFDLWRSRLALSDAVLNKIANENMFRFITSIWQEAQTAAERGGKLEIPETD